jgi:putative phosphoribosyl transferase
MFRDRREAGEQLAEKLLAYRARKDALVLALPRGGVVTGDAIATRLGLPLDVIIIRKIGFPGQPEFAIGAVAETGDVILNEQTISSYGVNEAYIKHEIESQKDLIRKRKEMYRGGKSLPRLAGKTIILADDGVATGSTVKAAIAALKRNGLAKLVLALPVAPPRTADELKGMVDELICLHTDPFFFAVGNYYSNFEQVTDEEVARILARYAPAKEEA